MTRRAFGLVVALGLTTGCLFGRVLYGEAPEECHFAPGAELAWAGHGHPEDFGLVPRGVEHPSLIGDIFVEAERAPGQQPDGVTPARGYCVLIPSAEDPSTASGSTVPEGWRPP